MIQTATWIKMKLGMQVGMMSLGMELGLGPSNFVLDGDPAPLPKRGAEPPKFSAHVHCGQTAGWMKLVLGSRGGRPQPRRLCVTCGPSPLPTKTGGVPSPIFGRFLLWPNSWMHQDATWYGAYATLCSTWTQLPPEKRAHPLPPKFWPMSIVAKWLDG